MEKMRGVSEDGARTALTPLRASLMNSDSPLPQLPHYCINCHQIRRKPRCRKHRGGKELQRYRLLLYYA